MTDEGRSRWSWRPAIKRRDPPACRPEAVLGGVEADGLIVNDGKDRRRVPWSAVQRIVAASSAGFVGDTALLVMELAGGDTLMVPEIDPHWPALVAAIETALPETGSYLAWQLRLMAAPDLPIEVYRRQSVSDLHGESG